MNHAKITTTCRGCGRLCNVDDMYVKDGLPYCSGCKPEGSRPLLEYMKENTKTLTTDELHKMLTTSPFETFDLSKLDVAKHAEQIGKRYGVNAADIKLIGVGLYFATEDRKVALTISEFGGEVSQLYYNTCQAIERNALVDEGKHAGEKRPESENMFA